LNKEFPYNLLLKRKRLKEKSIKMGSQAQRETIAPGGKILMETLLFNLVSYPKQINYQIHQLRVILFFV